MRKKIGSRAPFIIKLFGELRGATVGELMTAIEELDPSTKIDIEYIAQVNGDPEYNIIFEDNT